MSTIEIPAIKVHQWLDEWNKVEYTNAASENRRKPNPNFYIFSIQAGLLKKLSKVYPRKADKNRDIEIGIQRRHDPKRSEEIKRYIYSGYPLSDMGKNAAENKSFEDLRMPGWLPSSIVANILKPGTERGLNKLQKVDSIELIEKKGSVIFSLPQGASNPKWDPEVPPIEIIDGQHRLWAFDINDEISDDFELPVVAFYDLDITWQAYLFYTINVKPKKINKSLAYDLIPLLRVQKWLEKSPDTANIYKETRAQEIVECLWAYPKSGWHERINMLGDTQTRTTVTQAAFVRNLTATFIKTKSSKGLGGLFGAKLLDEFNSPLSWNRTQQASFIILSWNIMIDQINNCKLDWAKALRTSEGQSKLFEDKKTDPAFYGKFALISSDQGVRGFMHVINDFMYVQAEELKLRSIKWTNSDEIKEDRIHLDDVTIAIKDLQKSKANEFIKEICLELVKFDWRTSSEPSLSKDQQRNQMLFKGSSGYKELRNQLLNLLTQSKAKGISKIAKGLTTELGYVE